MGTRKTQYQHLLHVLLISACVQLLHGCYQPDLGAGGFRCNALGGGAGQCPDGYICLEDNPPLEPGVVTFSCSNREAEPQIEVELDQTTLVPGEDFTFSVELINVSFAPESVGGPPVEGQGHAHLYWDLVDADHYLGPPVVSEDPVTRLAPPGLGPGAHELIVVAVANNHVPLSPETRDSIAFTVE